MNISTNQVADRCHELIAKGNAIFGTNVVIGRIEWYQKGRAAGMAGRDENGYFLRFNLEVINQDAFMANTVPHEVAHLIVFALIKAGRSRDRGHGRDFKRVCQMLGGTGARCHNMTITKARIHREFKYVLPSGRIVMIKTCLHRKIQATESHRIMRDTKERLDRTHFVA